MFKKTPLIPVCAAVAVWAILAFHCQDLLLRTGERSLFLTTSMFFHDHMQSAGGLLSYICCFLSQFLSRPAAGAAIAVLLWAAASILAMRILHRSGEWSVLALIPFAALVAASMDMGYLIYIVKLEGWFFVPAVGIIAALLALRSYRCLSSFAARIIYILLWTAVGYPLLGAYALIGTAAMAASSAERDVRSLTCLIVALIALIASPLIWSGFYTTGRTADAFLAAIPLFPDKSVYRMYRIPYIVLAAYTVAAAAPIRIPALKKHVQISVRAGIALASFLFAYGFWYRDANFRAELQMASAIDSNDWKQVTRIYVGTTRKFQKSDAKAISKRDALLLSASGSRREDILDEYSHKIYAPTRLMVLYRNLALLKLGTAGSTAFRYKDGSRLPDSPEIIASAVQGGERIYLNYGLPNCCYHWCIEDGVEFGWNAEALKYAVRATLLTEDWGVADKYLSLLEKSPMHRSWAASQRRYMHDAGLIAESPEYSHIMPLICRFRNIDSDNGTLESFLIRYFSDYRPANASPEFDDAALLFAAQTQDIPKFWNSFSNWIKTHPSTDVPTHYQEAAYMYGSLEHSVDISKLPFAPEIPKSYQSFTTFASQHPVRDTRESSYAYEQKFGGTFYYFYYFIRGLQTY
ncbi:MAG: DUF6057 family protein [Bacteroidaceae bacterium]|nr:DUF6057 family protein [Bacteroidaceae bacterium]